MNNETVSLNEALRRLLGRIYCEQITLNEDDVVDDKDKWNATVVIAAIRINIFKLNEAGIADYPLKIYWSNKEEEFVCEFGDEKVFLSASFFDHAAELLAIDTATFLREAFWIEFFRQAKEKLTEE